MEKLGAAEWLSGLVVDGIVGGVGAVLGFVPQMLVLFLFLAILEDCGYMARIAFIMDRVFRKFGLSGKSFIPMLIGTGCGVPGVMASRTIENERDRRMTIMTTCFIPCGAKMPIIGLIAGALFGGSGLVAVSAYFIGVAAIIISGIMLKKTKMFAGEPAPFVMELPAYHVPTVGNVLAGHLGARLVFHQEGWHHHPSCPLSSCGSCRALAVEDGSFGMVEDMDNSVALAAIGTAICLHLCSLWALATGRPPWLPLPASLQRRTLLPPSACAPCAVWKKLLRTVAEICGRLLLQHFTAICRLQLHDLQPAVRTLLCGYGRHQA